RVVWSVPIDREKFGPNAGGEREPFAQVPFVAQPGGILAAPEGPALAAASLAQLVTNRRTGFEGRQPGEGPGAIASPDPAAEDPEALCLHARYQYVLPRPGKRDLVPEGQSATLAKAPLCRLGGSGECQDRRPFDSGKGDT